MKILYLTGLMIVLAMVAGAADQKEFTTNLLTIPDHGNLEFKAPKGWSLEKNKGVNPFGPRTMAYRSADGNISVQVTMFWDGFGPKQLKPTQKDMESLTENGAGKFYASGSVEKKVVLENLKGADVSGTFARFTDAEWVGKTPPKNEFTNVTAGMVRCGDLWGNFTILTNEKDGPSFKEALAILETLHKAKPNQQ